MHIINCNVVCQLRETRRCGLCEAAECSEIERCRHSGTRLFRRLEILSRDRHILLCMCYELYEYLLVSSRHASDGRHFAVGQPNDAFPPFQFPIVTRERTRRRKTNAKLLFLLRKCASPSFVWPMRHHSVYSAKFTCAHKRGERATWQ